METQELNDIFWEVFIHSLQNQRSTNLAQSVTLLINECLYPSFRFNMAEPLGHNLSVFPRVKTHDFHITRLNKRQTIIEIYDVNLTPSTISVQRTSRRRNRRTWSLATFIKKRSTPENFQFCYEQMKLIT